MKALKIAIALLIGSNCFAQSTSEPQFRISLSTGVNSGFFFDQRPLRVSYTGIHYTNRNGNLEEGDIHLATFFQSLDLSLYHNPTGLGIGLGLNNFLHSRELDGPFEKDGYIREHQTNLSLNLLYRAQLTKRFAISPQMGLGYRRSYHVYEFDFRDHVNEIQRILSHDLASNIGLKLTYDLPRNFNLGLGVYIFNTLYRESIEYNPSTSLNLNATIGYSLLSN